MSRDREKAKDDALDALLKKASAAAESGPLPGSACPDAEVMAAWLDGGLSKDLLAGVRAHVATCPRCQVVAAVMTKLDTAGAEAAKPQTSRRWLGWLVPVAAAAGVWVFTIWTTRQATVEQEEATAPAAEVAQAKAAPAATPTDAFRTDPKPEFRADELKDSGKRAQELGAADNKVKVDRAGADQPAKKRETQLAQAKPTEPGRVNESRDRQAGATATAAAPKAQANVATAAAAPPPPAAQRPAADTVAQPAARMMEQSRLEGKLLDTKEMVSPDPLVRWRVRGAVLEKSADAGKTWQPVKTGVTTELTGGAAVSATACWVVGRGGVVLLTTDGQTWRRLTFPEPTDLSSVRATDARTATVTTVEGREYTTSDAGATWIRRLILEAADAAPQEN